MKVVIAYDSFKGSLTAAEAVEVAAQAVLSVFPDALIERLPLADGGEGTAGVLREYMDAVQRSCIVHDPLMRRIVAEYAISRDGTTAIIDMASASGLELLAVNERNPLKTTTFGFGELLLDAVEQGCTKVLMGIGGSATNDAGAGMMEALGACFYDGAGNRLLPVGENLAKIRAVDLSSMKDLSHVEMKVLCDVDNVLYGPHGAAYVYSSQKGAQKEDLPLLDEGLRRFASLFRADPLREHCGAAGGLGYALMLLGAELVRGADAVIEVAGLEDKLLGADLVITGEGCSDRQTLSGKLPLGVLQIAKKSGVPVVILSGQVKDCEALLRAGFQKVRSIKPESQSLEEAMRPEVARKNLSTGVSEIIR